MCMYMISASVKAVDPSLPCFQVRLGGHSLRRAKASALGSGGSAKAQKGLGLRVVRVLGF